VKPVSEEKMSHAKQGAEILPKSKQKTFLVAKSTNRRYRTQELRVSFDENTFRICSHDEKIQYSKIQQMEIS